MNRLAKSLITVFIVVSAVSFADLSSAFDGKNNSLSYQELQFTEKNFSGNNSEFWSKFRESVMPEDSNKNNRPEHEKNSPPPHEGPPHEGPHNHQ